MREQNVLATDLYGLTAEKYSLGRSNIEVVEEMMAAGIEIIQYREKNKQMLDKYRECKQIREMTAEAGVQLIVNDDVDYIGVGPIFPTNTKEDVCSAVGLNYLDYVVENIDLPFVAIGGIKEHNIRQVKDRGADCIAMVTEIVGAEDIPSKVQSLRARLD